MAQMLTRPRPCDGADCTVPSFALGITEAAARNVDEGVLQLNAMPGEAAVGIETDLEVLAGCQRPAAVIIVASLCCMRLLRKELPTFRLQLVRQTCSCNFRLKAFKINKIIVITASMAMSMAVPMPIAVGCVLIAMAS